MSRYVCIQYAFDEKWITDGERGFLRQRLQPQHAFASSFRLRQKMHQQPHGARPVANLTRAWIQPISFWLVGTLPGIQNSLPAVAISTDQVQDKLKNVVVSRGAMLSTIDV